MNSLSQLILIAGLAHSLVLVTSNSDLPIRTKSLLMHQTTNTLSEPHALCGDVLINNGTGDVFYKPFEQISKNERCVWIVATPGAVGYNVNIQYLGQPTNQPEMGQQLIFTGVRAARSGSTGLTSIQPENTGTVRISNSNLLIITFISSSEFHPISSGFALSYEGILRGNISATSTLSTQHLLRAPTYEFKYPVGSTTYTNYELAAFVFPPSTNNQSVSAAQILYKRDALETSCLDYLTIYKFRRSQPEKWEFDARLCSDLESYYFNHNDISLIIFQSDASRVYGGFWLYAYPGTPCDYIL